MGRDSPLHKEVSLLAPGWAPLERWMLSCGHRADVAPGSITGNLQGLCVRKRNGTQPSQAATEQCSLLMAETRSSAPAPQPTACPAPLGTPVAVPGGGDGAATGLLVPAAAGDSRHQHGLCLDMQLHLGDGQHLPCEQPSLPSSWMSPRWHPHTPETCTHSTHSKWGRCHAHLNSETTTCPGHAPTGWCHAGGRGVHDQLDHAPLGNAGTLCPHHAPTVDTCTHLPRDGDYSHG